jgi:acyl-CoA synthetase (AMP-forming)/AMP-acid ligase II
VKELIAQRTLLPAFETYADKVGFHDGDWHGTFAQHASRTLRLADAMKRELGVDKGDRFAIMAGNSHQYMELYHAAFFSGAIANPLNLRLAGRELQFILADSETEVVFVDATFAEHFARNIADVRHDLPIRTIVLLGDGDVPHDVKYEDLVNTGQPVVPPEPEETDPVILMYTGGTTALPKGVLLDSRAEQLNVYHIGAVLGFGDWRVYLHQTPMFHAASTAAVLGVPGAGATSVFIPMFEPARVMRLIETYGVNWTTMVPTMIAMVMNHPEFRPERLAPLSDLVYGASPMPAALLDRIQSTLPQMRLSQGYGMTECSSVLTLLTDRDHARGGEILRSAGKAVPGVNICIQDDEGQVLGPGDNGEICARGGNFMIQYWNRPVETDQAFRGGWYHTGDEGHMDENGYVYVVDRVKDMIVTGGENVYSIEVENAISTHPAVAQVAVIGIPHDTLVEQVHAIVVLHPGATTTEDEIKVHARQTIGGYKVPKSVEFRPGPLPLSGALKPLKRELRRPYWEKVRA